MKRTRARGGEESEDEDDRHVRKSRYPASMEVNTQASEISSDEEVKKRKEKKRRRFS